MTRRPGERTMLVLLLVLHTAVYAWLILTSRVPRGHDTLSVYILQYVFLSNAVARRDPRGLSDGTPPTRNAQGATSGRTPGLRPASLDGLCGARPGGCSGSFARDDLHGRTYGCGSAPAFDRLPPLGDRTASIATRRGDVMSRDRNGS